jgi:hypothetical protein
MGPDSVQTILATIVEKGSYLRYHHSALKHHNPDDFNMTAEEFEQAKDLVYAAECNLLEAAKALHEFTQIYLDSATRTVSKAGREGSTEDH